jgi:hypothetical protein
VIYRAELSERVLGQLGRFPAMALDALIATMAAVVEYPADPLRTFPTDDPYVRRAGRHSSPPGVLRVHCCAGNVGPRVSVSGSREVEKGNNCLHGS